MVTFEKVFKTMDMFQIYNASFTIPRGYIMGLVGVNGSGKTTLLNILLGLYGIDSGMIKRYDSQGKEIRIKEFRDRCGYVLQGDWFEGMLSFSANAEIFGKYYSKYDRTVLAQYMERFSLNLNKKYNEASRGERLKFQFAFAMAHDPELLVLDEPTASFDPEFRQDFLKIMTEFVEDGEHSVILATHITEELDRIADYITFVDNGQIIFSLDKETLSDSFRLVKGEDYKLNLIPKERMIYKERGSYSSTALVKNSGYYKYDKEVTATIPTIEDIMYYCVKGGAERAKIIAE